MTNKLTKVAAIVLAAGRGTRMKSKDKNKVAYALNGKPMIAHTLDHLQSAGVGQIIVVVGYQADSVKKALGDSVTYVTQKEQLGTGHALSVALPQLHEEIDTVLAVSGDDSSFYPTTLYQEMVDKQSSTSADVLVLTLNKNNPTGLGRIIRNDHGEVTRIVEEKNATEKERQIKEINTGFYCFDREFVTTYISHIKPNPVTKELYATDLVEIALSQGKTVKTHLATDSSVWHGVNTQEDYKKAREKYNKESHD